MASRPLFAFQSVVGSKSRLALLPVGPLPPTPAAAAAAARGSGKLVPPPTLPPTSEAKSNKDVDASSSIDDDDASPAADDGEGIAISSMMPGIAISSMMPGIAIEESCTTSLNGIAATAEGEEALAAKVRVLLMVEAVAPPVPVLLLHLSASRGAASSMVRAKSRKGCKIPTGSLPPFSSIRFSGELDELDSSADANVPATSSMAGQPLISRREAAEGVGTPAWARACCCSTNGRARYGSSRCIWS